MHLLLSIPNQALSAVSKKNDLANLSNEILLCSIMLIELSCCFLMPSHWQWSHSPRAYLSYIFPQWNWWQIRVVCRRSKGGPSVISSFLLYSGQFGLLRYPTVFYSGVWLGTHTHNVTWKWKKKFWPSRCWTERSFNPTVHSTVECHQASVNKLQDISGNYSFRIDLQR